MNTDRERTAITSGLCTATVISFCMSDVNGYLTQNTLNIAGKCECVNYSHSKHS